MGNVAELMAEWRMWQESQGLSDRTIAERAITIVAYLNHTGEDPLAMTPRGIVKFTAQAHLAQSSRASYHASVRAYCAWLIQTDQRDDDPSMKTPRPRRKPGQPRPLTDDEVIRLLDVVNRGRTLLMIKVGLLSGLRVHEIAKVRGEDFDLVNHTFTVTGKGAKTETIALHPLLEAEARQQPRVGYWFPSYIDNKHGAGGSTHIRSHAVTAAITRAMIRAGIRPALVRPEEAVKTPHSLRHWYATTLIVRGAPLAIVQRLMRHTSPATTAIYAQVPMRDQHRGVELLYLPSRALQALSPDWEWPNAA